MNRILVMLKMNRVLVVLFCFALISCRTHEKIVYLQDAADQSKVETITFQGIQIQPKDILSIVVSSKSPELAISYNLPLYTYQAASTLSSSAYSQRLLGYLVDLDGEIDFPALGKLKVAGMTREQLSELIKQKLVNEEIIKDAVVTTEFMNFKISVLGEVRMPGTFSLQDDKITIFEAIGRAGDLTIYGKREDVLVIRRDPNDVIKYYRVDLRSTSITDSPVFFLQQNDVVYVSPNKIVAERSRINENRTLGVGASLASLLINLIILLR